jgi:hypothetical protein
MNEAQDESNDLVKTLEMRYLPLLKRLASELAGRYPGLRLNVYSSSSGSKTSYQGHSISLECIFPEQPVDQPDNVCLAINLCHLSTSPRIMADVVWGHPSGYCEASLIDAWTTQEDWPMATSSTLHWLAQTFANLCQSFEEAIHRGHPPVVE